MFLIKFSNNYSCAYLLEGKQSFRSQMELDKGKISKPIQIDDDKLWGEKKSHHFLQSDPNKWTKSKSFHSSIDDDKFWCAKKVRHFSQTDGQVESIVHSTQTKILSWIDGEQVI